jgi:molybdenum cofactor cytidylyltransferase
VLAAGASRRMGRNKMLLPVNGEPLIRRTVRRSLESGLSPVVVVLGHEAGLATEALAGLGCETVLNPAFAGPMSGSLHKGLGRLAADVDAALIVLGDMPFVTIEMLAALVSATASSTAPLAVSRYGEVTAPPLLFRRALFGELLAYSGEGCGKAVVKAHWDEALFLNWPESVLTDIDTPEDLKAAEALLG